MDSYVLTDERRAAGRLANERWRDVHQPDRVRQQRGALIVPSEVDKAYAAGFLDGEGYVGALRKPEAKYIGTRISISQIDIDPLVFMQERWGGVIGKHAAYQPNRRDAANWVLSNKTLIAVLLRDTMPFLRVKIEQAMWLLELAEMPKLVRGAENEDLIARRIAIYDELRRLNRRGRPEEVI